MQWLAVGLGAAFGAMLRTWLARFNGAHEWMPLGTLAANVLGGLLIGMALVYAERLHPHARFFIITGFLGGLTTFSTFSAEVFAFIQKGEMAQALAWVGLQVAITLAATALGFYGIRLLAQA